MKTPHEFVMHKIHYITPNIRHSCLHFLCQLYVQRCAKHRRRVYRSNLIKIAGCYVWNYLYKNRDASTLIHRNGNQVLGICFGFGFFSSFNWNACFDCLFTFMQMQDFR